jgi:hypothetical protein
MNYKTRAEMRVELLARPLGLSRVGAGLLGVAVLCFHTSGAFAQQPAPEPAASPQNQIPGVPGGEIEAAPVPSSAPGQPQAPAPGQPYSYPPGYAPPPGYGAPPQYPPPPPPGYGNAPGYRQGPGYGGMPQAPSYAYPPQSSYYPPPPPPSASRPVTERPFMIGGSLGFAGLRFHDQNDQSTSDAGVGYSARLGFGIAPTLILLLGVDGATAGDGNFVYDQTVYYVGLQAFLTRQLFLRGGAGIGNITQKDNQGNFLFFGKTGLGLTGSAGVELIQGYNWSLELAAQITSGFYADSERWTSGAVNIGFNFF